MYPSLKLDTTASLLSESKVLVKPASVDSIVTSAGQEDHVSMGGFAARKAEMLLHNVSHILGIELLMCTIAANIIDLPTSDKLNHILRNINKTIDPPTEDRFFGPDIEEATRLVIADLQMI
jgi:histidine ammonia-lyase